MTSSGALSARQQAARLLGMAIEAREHGRFELSDRLTDVASQYLDRAEALESAGSSLLQTDTGKRAGRYRH